MTTGYFAGASYEEGQIRATIWLLRYFRRFEESGMSQCIDPTQNPYYRDTLDREQARQLHKRLIDVAINRKAGIPDVSCRKQETLYQNAIWRDCRRVRDNVNHRIIVRQFETDEIRRRYSHLLFQDEE
jgi:hypothetical protein